MKKLSLLFISILPLGFVTSCSEISEHNFWLVDEIPATCSLDGVKEHLICHHCDKVFDLNKNEITADSLVIPATGNHVFDKEVVDDKYKVADADCLHHIHYYKSCSCGISSKDFSGETFEGPLGNHSLIRHGSVAETQFERGHGLYYTCSTCEKMLSYDGVTEIDEIPWLSRKIVVDILNGKAIDNFDATVSGYLDCVDDKTTDNNEIAEYLYKVQQADKFGKYSTENKITLKFDISSECTLPVTLKIAKDSGMENIVREEIISSISTKQVSFNNFVPGKYYYQLNDSSDFNNYSDVDSFEVGNHLRTIYTSNKVQNVRDMGSWNSKYGKVNYGLIYRTANWTTMDSATERLFVEELGIKNEMDVRLGSSYTTSEHPVNGINYIQRGLTDDYTAMLTHANTITNIGKIFNEFLTDENNFPYAFHCTSGADRTGLMGLLIGGVLGFADEDLYRDYELTSFFKAQRYRSSIVVSDNAGEKIYSFDPSGECLVGSTYYKFGLVISNLMESYKTEDNTISSAVVNFLKTKCSVTEDSLSKFRSIMISTEKGE